MARKTIHPADYPSGLLERDTEMGTHYWMGSPIDPCCDCNRVVTNVDDCGHFGDPSCPQFGRGRNDDEPVRKINMEHLK